MIWLKRNDPGDDGLNVKQKVTTMLCNKIYEINRLLLVSLNKMRINNSNLIRKIKQSQILSKTSLATMITFASLVWI